MQNLDFLNGHVSPDRIHRLTEIFSQAHSTRSESVLQKLQADLIQWLRQKEPLAMTFWHTSPSGRNHILVVDHLCMLISIFGITVLFKDYLFCEGELDLTNFHWIERDNLVIFDSFYIIRHEWERFICHYTREDFFFYKTASTKKQMPGFPQR